MWPLDRVFGVRSAPTFWPAAGPLEILTINAAVGEPIVFLALVLLGMQARRHTGWSIGLVVLLIFGADALAAALWAWHKSQDRWYPYVSIVLASNVLSPIPAAWLIHASSRSWVRRAASGTTLEGPEPDERSVYAHFGAGRLLLIVAGVTSLFPVYEVLESKAPHRMPDKSVDVREESEGGPSHFEFDLPGLTVRLPPGIEPKDVVSHSFSLDLDWPGLGEAVERGVTRQERLAWRNEHRVRVSVVVRPLEEARGASRRPMEHHSDPDEEIS